MQSNSERSLVGIELVDLHLLGQIFVGDARFGLRHVTQDACLVVAAEGRAVKAPAIAIRSRSRSLKSPSSGSTSASVSPSSSSPVTRTVAVANGQVGARTKMRGWGSASHDRARAISASSGAVIYASWPLELARSTRAEVVFSFTEKSPSVLETGPECETHPAVG